jgi:photosystem II stability/assembly factor-like uncharacterized protein
MKTIAKGLVLGLLAAAAIAPAAQGQVQVGSSGWAWGNPLPQGNSIFSSSFAGPQGYAVGAFGTLLATGDGGTTWVGLRSGTFRDLTEVQAISPTSLFAGGGCVGRRSDDAGRTFVRVAFTPVESTCREQLADAHFLSPTTGYLTLTDGTVLFTNNNGQTFSPRTKIPGDLKTSDLFFLSDTVGLASAGSRIFRTDDGANSWKEVFSGRTINDLLFLDPATGVATGDGGTFLQTTDGGATWTAKPFGAQDRLGAVACANTDVCLTVAGDGSTLLRTADGGETTTRITVSAQKIATVGFATATRVVAIGGGGVTSVSDDAGETFAPIGSRLTGTYRAVVAGGPNAAYALGDDGALAKTADGGKTWVRGNVPTSENIVDVSFPTSAVGYALDSDGGLFGTSDGGTSWRTLDAGAPSSPEALEAPSASTVILIGRFGVRRSTNAGESFQAVRGKGLTRLTAADPAGGSVVAFARDRVLRSSDNGRKWKSVPLPKRGTRVRALDFVSAQTGYLIDSAGAVHRTDNGGKRWRMLPAVGFGDPDDVVFGSKEKGYLVVDRFGSPSVNGGWLLRTEDGGRTWYPQFVVKDEISPGGLSAGPNGVDYLLAGGGLLSSTTGGASGTPSTLTIRTERTKLRKAGTITISGRLQPGSANEEVTISRRQPGKTSWSSQTVKTASNGAFTTRWKVGRGETTFVAQWAGGFRSRGDSSPGLTVRVGR